MIDRKEYMKKYQQEHKEAFRIANQKYRDKDREKYNEHNREYRKRKYKEAKENAELVIKYKVVLDKIKEYIDTWKFETAGFGACMEYEDIQEIYKLLEEIE